MLNSMLGGAGEPLTLHDWTTSTSECSGGYRPRQSFPIRSNVVSRVLVPLLAVLFAWTGSSCLVTEAAEGQWPKLWPFSQSEPSDGEGDSRHVSYEDEVTEEGTGIKGLFGKGAGKDKSVHRAKKSTSGKPSKSPSMLKAANRRTRAIMSKTKDVLTPWDDDDMGKSARHPSVKRKSKSRREKPRPADVSDWIGGERP